MNDNEKKTLKYLMAWQRHMRDSRSQIPAECNKYTLIAFCTILASYGEYGVKCFKSDQNVAKDLSINRRHLAKYRWLAIELGWLRLTGETKGRVYVVDINIPDRPVDAPALPERFKDKRRRSTDEQTLGELAVRIGVNKPSAAITTPDDDLGDPWASQG